MWNSSEVDTFFHRHAFPLRHPIEVSALLKPLGSRRKCTLSLSQRLLSLAAELMALGLVLLVANLKGIPLYILTGDPTAVRNVPFFTGFLSNVGVLLWAGATAICLFSAFIAIRILQESEFSEFSSRFRRLYQRTHVG
jgi:hypothetical protein